MEDEVETEGSDYDSFDSYSESESDATQVSDESDDDQRVLDEARVRFAIRELISHSMQFRILVAGKTGSGKSALINTLLMKEITREGGALTSETSGVMPCSGPLNLSESNVIVGRVNASSRPVAHITTMIDNVEVTLWDTPGLSDPSMGTEQTLREIENCRGNVDLFVYCVQMTQNRLYKDETDSIKRLTNSMGTDVWKTAVIALTFANDLRVPPNCDDSLDDYYEEKVAEWKTMLRSTIKDAGLPRDDVVRVPVIPCGYRDNPPPCTPNWATFFWYSCMRRVGPDRLPAFMMVTQATIINDPKEIRSLMPLKPFSRRLQAMWRIFCSNLKTEYPEHVGLRQYQPVLNVDTQRLLDLLIEEITAIKKGTWKRDPLTVFIVVLSTAVILVSFLYKHF